MGEILANNRILLYIIPFVLICGCSEKNAKQNDLQIAKLKGKVKSVESSIQTHYSYGSQTIIEKGGTTIVSYNLQGFEIQIETRNNKGSDDGEYSNSITEIIRDADNKKLEEKVRITSGTPSYRQNSTKYTYDKDGRLNKTEEYYDNDLSNTTSYETDEKGNVLKVAYPTWFETYKYDKNNNVIEKKGTRYTETYEYDKNEHLTVIKTLWDDGHTGLTNFFYNDNGDIVKKEVNNGGKPEVTTYKYDSNNNLSEVIDERTDEVTTYEYDNTGNWIKEVIQGNSLKISERKIEYYSDEDVKKNTNNGNTANGKSINASSELSDSESSENKRRPNIFTRIGQWIDGEKDESNNGNKANGNSDNTSYDTPKQNSSNNNIKDFNDIQITLLDARVKKAKLYLGEPDVTQRPFGHLTKGFLIYYNRVSTNSGIPNHLVLFIRLQKHQWGDDAIVENIFSIKEGEQACFGIHCLKILNKKIYSNALNCDICEGN
jgi:hypothetical protein